MKNNIICVFICYIIILELSIVSYCGNVYANQDIDISSRSAVVMEGNSKKLVYEKDKDVKVNPASITKIMTLLLIYEALDSGKIKMSDQVTISEHAASMGGSQVYLEPGEKQSVETLIKCICIASANDGAVAMAEFVAGSESSFVNLMNEKAHKLGMNNTMFKNCCGLDVEGHYSTAYDVALMSRELIVNHPQIIKYTTTWMDSFIHRTRKGEKEFGLTNTNKLVRTYDGITGLKTGSTSLAKYCLSATAKRNEIDIIAVVMGAPEHKLRYSEAAKLLDYGFSKVKCYKYRIKNDALKNIKISNGKIDTIDGYIKDDFIYNQIGDEKINIEYKVKLNRLSAPIKKGDKIGRVEYYNGGIKIGESKVYAKNTVLKSRYLDAIFQLLDRIVS